MADNLRKYTTQEVLNKVYTDSSGNSIGLNAATSKETLNAVLTSGADSLNVALSGGTISGDVTISGDLTVTGGGDFAYSEVITGDMRVQKAALSSADYDTNSIVIAENSDYAFFQTASATRGGIFFGDASSAYSGGVIYDHATSPEKLSFYSGAAIRMIIDTNSRISLSNNDSGTGNTVFGYQAGNNLDSGSNYNVFIGHDAANQVLDDASNNVAIGVNSSRGLTQGDHNVSVGSNTLYSTTTGTELVAVGSNAGYNNTIGRYSTAIGFKALYSDTRGDTTTAIGHKSLYSQASDADNDATNNVGLGYWSGYYNVIGVANTYLGSRSGVGASGNSNSFNTGVGSYALNAITTGSNNVGVGTNALMSATTGGNNSVLTFVFCNITE